MTHHNSTAVSPLPVTASTCLDPQAGSSFWPTGISTRDMLKPCIILPRFYIQVIWYDCFVLFSKKSVSIIFTAQLFSQSKVLVCSNPSFRYYIEPFKNLKVLYSSFNWFKKSQLVQKIQDFGFFMVKTFESLYNNS